MTPRELVSRLRRSDIARHRKILDATVAELQDLGYDRMTMDGVAKRAEASKATIYRHWPNKAQLVVAAIRRMKGADDETTPDTGTLRGDLIALLTGSGPQSADDQLCVMRGMVSACGTDAELAAAFFDQVVDAKRTKARDLIRKAQTRGEVSQATDIEFLVDVAPAMLVFRHLLTPYPVDENYVTRLVDDVWLPLLTGLAATSP